MSINVTFVRSGKTIPWEDRYENILQMAEENDIAMDSGCREGYCGACKTRLVSGEVSMANTDALDEDDVKAGMISPCVAVPKTDTDVDA